MTWAIEVDGVTWGLDDLTLAGAAQVCDTAGCRWLDLDPVGNPGHLGALLAAFTAAQRGLPFNEAVVSVARLPFPEALSAVLLEVPKADEEA